MGDFSKANDLMNGVEYVFDEGGEVSIPHLENVKRELVDRLSSYKEVFSQMIDFDYKDSFKKEMTLLSIKCVIDQTEAELAFIEGCIKLVKENDE